MNMNCEDIIERLIRVDQSDDELEQRKLAAHLETCESCQDAWRGAIALRMVKNRPAQRPADGLFEAVVSYATRQPGRATGKSQFWLGAAAGGLLAAGVAFAILAFGIFTVPPDSGTATAAVTMALGEQQEVSIAIDAERDLPNTTVNVVLYGGFEIVGFGAQRELTWSTDLEKGVNKLTLPLSAVEAASGQVLVRLEHEGTHREFRIELNITG